MTKTEDWATKRPWIIKDFSNIYGSEDTNICYCNLTNGNTYPESQSDNAELIVKAVNRDHLFEELVEALKQCHLTLKYKYRNTAYKSLKTTIESALAYVQG